MKKAEKGLTALEQDIMKILWEKERGMTNNEIADCMKDQKISSASVAQAMKRLLNKGVVKVDEHVLVSNVYARMFSPCLTRDEYLREELGRLERTAFGGKKHGLKNLVISLIDSDDGCKLSKRDIEDLERFLKQKKTEL